MAKPTLPGIIARAWRTITTTTRTITAHHAARHDRAFAIGTALNIGFVAAEIAFGLAANSMALLADAAHNFGDVLGLLLGWGATWLTRLPPTRRRTYGWGRSSILAALLNATILLIGVGAIGVEAVQRLFSPAPVMEGTVILVAAAGIVGERRHRAAVPARPRRRHQSARAVPAHGRRCRRFGGRRGGGAADHAHRLAVARSAGEPRGSASSSLLTTWGLLRESIDLAMDAVPGGVAHDEVQDYLASVPGVLEVHDLHIWGLSTTQTALTAHLVCADASDENRLHDVTAELRDRFGIGHATLQIETDAEAELCRLRPHDVV